LFKFKNKYFIFKKNKNCDILFYNNIKNIYLDTSYKIKNLDQSQINLYYLIKVIFISIIKLNFKIYNLKNLYFYELINSFNPKIFISNEISLAGFRVKKMFPNIYCVVYQSAVFWDLQKQSVKEKYSNLKCDYFLVYHKYFTEYFNQVNCQFLISGSIYNNSIKINKLKKEFDIMFISEFRDADTKKFKYPSEAWNHNNYSNVIAGHIVQTLSEYSKKNNKKFIIALSSNRLDKINSINYQNENSFYQKYSDNFITIKDSSYNLADKSKLIICLNSNLGPELLSKNKKVLFINSVYFLTNWYFFNSDYSKIYLDKLDKKEVFKKLDYLLAMQNDEWNDYMTKINKPLLYNENNKLLIDLIDKLINK
jgi:surface carbohydrate biosynthesis protein